MKKILFRKLFIDYMSFFLIALLASTIIIWVFQAVNFLDIMSEDGRDYLVYIRYSLYNYPKIFMTIKFFPKGEKFKVNFEGKYLVYLFILFIVVIYLIFIII